MGDRQDRQGRSASRPRPAARRVRHLLALLALAAAATIAPVTPAAAFSVLTHEEVVDLAWDDTIAPLLRRHFPGIEPACIEEARRYAYGGAIVADAGYFPGGSRFASDLFHYVRTGDLAGALVANAQGPDELAFALGVLAHYVSDSVGHEKGTNLAVPMAFPKLRARYGDVVTYEQSPRAHIRLEMGFDALECARRGWLPRDFDAFLDFAVADEVLGRAFAGTYDLDLQQVFPDFDSAIRTYRFAVTEVFPALLKSSIKAEVKAHPRSRYRVPRAAFEARYGKHYRRPGLGARVVAFLVRHLGLGLDPKLPPASAEHLLRDSLATTLARYRELIAQADAGDFAFPNRNIDTGARVRAGDYRLVDETYARLLGRLDHDRSRAVSPELRRDLLAFYADPEAPIATKLRKRDWRNTMRSLERLREASAPARGDRVVVAGP